MAPPDRPSAEATLGELRWLRALALRLVRDEHAADDLVQETWLEAALRGPAGLEGARLRKWLATVARSRMRRRVRDEAVRAHHESALPERDAPEPPPDEVERLRRQRLVADVVLALREPYRSAVLLRYQDGWSYARIAARHGISRDAGRTRVWGGLALLRAELDRAHDGDRGAWCALLAGLVDRDAAPFATALTTGGIAMGTKSLVAAAATLLVTVGLVAWAVLGNEPSAPSAAKHGERSAATLRPSAPEPAPPADAERVAVASPAAPVGALAVDLDRDLHGRVTDPAGDLVAGARVAALHDPLQQIDRSGFRAGVEVAAVRTDERGEFAIPLELGRIYTLVVEKEGFAAATRAFRSAGERVDVELDFPAALAGRVYRESDGVGLSAAITGWVLRDNATVHEIRGRSSADGTFRIGGLEARRIFLLVQPEGAADPDLIEAQPVAGEVVELEVACPSGFDVRGTVRDAKTGLAIAGAEVVQSPYHDIVHTDADGRYVLEHFREVDGLTARAPGYAKTKELVRPVGGVATVDFALFPAARIIGRVVDGDGAPVANAFVAATGFLHNAARQLDWYSARTAADGTFTVENVHGYVRHALLLFHESHASATYDLSDEHRWRDPIDVGTVALKPPSLLRGVVVDAASGEPLPGLRVALHGANADRGLLGGSPIPRVDFYVARRTAHLDHLGRFSFANLGAGSYELEVWPPGSKPVRSPIAVAAASVVDGVRIEIDAGLAIAGHVSSPTGDPVDAYLRALEPSTSLERGYARSKDDGSFRIAGLAPGLYSIEARPQRDPSVAPRTIESVAAGTRELAIVLPLGDVVAGRVLDAQGRGVGHVSVRGTDEHGKDVAFASTDPEGRFTLHVEATAVVDVLATPPPHLASGRVATVSQHSATLAGVAAGTRDLVLMLPER